MTNVNVGRWLLVTLAVAALAMVAPVVGAHGTEPIAGDAPGDNETAAEWTAWMASDVTDHMGPDAVEWMESHMGVTVDEMRQDRTDGHHGSGTHGNGQGQGHGNGQGHGC